MQIKKNRLVMLHTLLLQNSNQNLNSHRLVKVIARVTMDVTTGTGMAIKNPWVSGNYDHHML